MSAENAEIARTTGGKRLERNHKQMEKGISV